MARITTLFFDVGGVCLTNGWDHIAREKAAAQFSYDFTQSEEVHSRIVEDFECGRMSIETYVEKMACFKDRPFTTEDFIRFMKSQSKPIKSSLDVLESLANHKQYTLATINNESLAINLYRIKTYHLDRYFSTFFSSCFLGVMKPNCLIFQRALWILQRKGEECLFIDDREENVSAAQECGIQAVYLKNAEDLAEVLNQMKIAIQ